MNFKKPHTPNPAPTPNQLFHSEKLSDLSLEREVPRSNYAKVCIACAYFEARGHLAGYCTLSKTVIPDGSDPSHACAQWKVAEANHAMSEIIQMSVNQIEQSEYMMRRIDETVVADLVVSIQAHGLLQPLMVRKGQDRYVVVFGRHRLIACQRLGWENVPVIVREVSEREARFIQIVENIQRNIKLDAVREGQLYSELHKQDGLSTYAIGRKIGKSAVYVQDRISIYEKLHPKIQTMVSQGVVNASIGHRIAEAPRERQLDLATKVEADNLSVAQLENLLRHSTEPVKCDCRDCPTHGRLLKIGKQPPLDQFYFAGAWIRVRSNIEERSCIFCGHVMEIGEYSFPLRFKGTLTTYESCQSCAFARAPPDFEPMFVAITSQIAHGKLSYGYSQKHQISNRPFCPKCGSNQCVQTLETQKTRTGFVERYRCTKCVQRFALTRIEKIRKE